jgi:hypothetical protein
VRTPANCQAVACQNTFQIGAKPVATIFHEIVLPRSGNKIIDFLAHQNSPFFWPSWDMKLQPKERLLSDMT